MNKIFSKILQLLLLIAIPATHGWAAVQVLSPERIIQEAEAYLKNHLPWEADSLDVSILYSGGGLELSRGAVELEFQAPARALEPGRIPLALYVKVNRVVEKRLRLTAMVSLSYDLVKTLRPVARGEVIAPDDVALERVSSTRLPTRMATRLEDVVGYEARQTLKAGRTVPMTSLKRPPMIAKGDRVTLRVNRGSLSITATGQAREDGYRDNLLPVTNLQTKKTVYGRVVDENTVEVVF